MVGIKQFSLYTDTYPESSWIDRLKTDDWTSTVVPFSVELVAGHWLALVGKTPITWGVGG